MSREQQLADDLRLTYNPDEPLDWAADLIERGWVRLQDADHQKAVAYLGGLIGDDDPDIEIIVANVIHTAFGMTE